MKLFTIILILLFLGLLPYIDNFAHIFGFIYGFFASLIFLPYIVVNESDKRRKQIQTVASILALTALTVVGAWLFTANWTPDEAGYGSIIQHLNCVQIVDNFCSNFHLGSKLESRVFEY